MRSIKIAILSAIVLGFLINLGNAQTVSRKSTKNDFIILRAEDNNAFTKVSAPLQLHKGAQKQATFDVTYNGFSPEAEIAFQYAVDIWSSIISSPVPIKVEANWDSLGPQVLGAASAGTFWRDFTNVPRAGTWYPTPLAEKLYGAELNHADSSDIIATFNKKLGRWYFKLDGNCPAGQYDLVSVVLHELCHGLGFQGSMNISEGQGSWGFSSGYPFIYDRFTEDGSGQKLLNTAIYANPSSQLAAVLTGNNVYFNERMATTANSFTPVKLHAPANWEASSSYSHLNETTYPAGNLNSLMTPSLSAAEAIHHPGNVTLGIFEDMGWTTNLVLETTIVYPGDLNNDGTVDANDIFSLGVHFLKEGVSREEETVTWGAKEALVWNDTAATFADANGDGIVDERDIIGIGVNWNNTYTTNSNAYIIDLTNKKFLMQHKENFRQIYYALQGSSTEIKEMRQLINSIFNFGQPLPENYTLDQNYPNPFNPETTIRFSLPEKQNISLIVTNTLGQVVKTIIENKSYDAGIHTTKFDASSLANGVYVYTLKSQNFNQSKKMIVLK